VQIEFADHEKAPAAEPERRVRWDQELRQWVRSDAKDGAAPASTMTAEVVDLRPNGVVVLQAVKRRTVNKDEETVRLTCEVAAGKTSSENLANLTMTYDGAGVDGAKPGFLGWLFGKLWPF
jgi:flagellar basal body L-ring protein FlgH